MTEREEQAHLRDDENREEFAIRRAERELTAEEHQLEQELKDFEQAEERAKREIEEEWRKEHSGHDPERPPDWKSQ